MSKEMIDLTARHLFGTSTNYAEWGGRIAQMYTSGKELLAERDRLAVENGILRAALEGIASTVIIIKADSAPIDISQVIDLIRKAQSGLEQANKVKGEVSDAE